MAPTRDPMIDSILEAHSARYSAEGEVSRLRCLLAECEGWIRTLVRNDSGLTERDMRRSLERLLEKIRDAK